jgi:hypothetical protein
MGKVDFLGGFLEKDPCCRNAMPGGWLRLKDGDFQAAHGRGFRSDEPSEAGADNHEIVGLWSARHGKNSKKNQLTYSCPANVADM